MPQRNLPKMLMNRMNDSELPDRRNTTVVDPSTMPESANGDATRDVPPSNGAVGPEPMQMTVDGPHGVPMRIDKPATPKRKYTELRVAKNRVKPLEPFHMAVARFAYIRTVNTISWMWDTYVGVSSYLATHRRGSVTHMTFHRRALMCVKCPHRYEHGGLDYCGGANAGGGCGCGEKKNVVTGKLPVLGEKLECVGFRCPVNLFGYGDTVESSIDGSIEHGG